MSESRPVTRTLACGSNASPPVEKGKRGWRRFSAGSLAAGTILAFESFSIIRLHSSELTLTLRRRSCKSLSRPQLSPPRIRTQGDRPPYAWRATPKWRADARTARRGSIEASSSTHTSLGRGLYSGHDPEGQKGTACSEAPVFGREFNCISTCLKVKLAEEVGVQLTQSAASLAAVRLAESYLASPFRNDCHPRGSGVALSLCKSAASAAHAPVVVCVAHACLLAQGG